MIKQTLVGFALLMIASGANALLIDFTSNEWSGVTTGNPYGQHVAGVGYVELEAFGGDMTFNAGDNGGCLAGGGSTWLACDGDGIGIGDDEISHGLEALSVSFASPVDVISIFLLDLFDNSRESEEAVILSVGTDLGINFVSGSSVDVGGLTISAISEGGVSHLFFAANPWSPMSDFALAAIDVSPTAVPEPGALSMLGLGLIAIGLLRKRRLL